MSALPPKADIAGRQLDVRFVPKADFTRRQSQGLSIRQQAWSDAVILFEDFVNRGKECLRNCQAESGSRLGVDGKLELGRLLDRNIARFCAAKNFVHISAAFRNKSG